MTTITRNRYLSTTEFNRVRLAFQSAGFEAPKPDTAAGGAYVSNVADQYRPHLTETQVKAVIRHGLTHSVSALKASKVSLTEMVNNYELATM